MNYFGLSEKQAKVLWIGYFRRGDRTLIFKHDNDDLLVSTGDKKNSDNYYNLDLSQYTFRPLRKKCVLYTEVELIKKLDNPLLRLKTAYPKEYERLVDNFISKI